MNAPQHGGASAPITNSAPMVTHDEPQGRLVFAAGALRQALAMALAVTGKANTIPVLNCVLIRMAEGGTGFCEIIADNLDQHIRITVPASGRIDPVCLPAGRLAALLTGLAKDDLVAVALVTADEPDIESKPRRVTRAMIDLPDGRASLMTLPAGDFPEGYNRLGYSDARLDGSCDAQIKPLPGEIIWGEAFSLPLADVLALSRFASTEETRYYLNGVCLDISEAGIMGVATDGHRLARQMLAPRGNAMADGAAIVPGSALTILGRIGLGKAAVTARLGIGERSMRHRIAAGNLETITVKAPVRIAFAGEVGGLPLCIETKLIDGDYPDWRKILPKHDSAPLTFDRDALKARIARLAAVASGPTHRVITLHADALPDARLRVTGSASDGEGGKVTLVLPIDAGWPFEIAFNARYLAEVLAFLPAGAAQWAMGAPTDPTEMTGGARAIVLMPMRVSEGRPLPLPEGVRA